MKDDKYQKFNIRQSARNEQRRTAQQILDDADDFSDFLKRPSPARKSPEHEERNNDLVDGVPMLAIIIIVGNFTLWSVGLVAYWIGRLSVTYIVMGVIFLVIGFAIWLAVAYIMWRFFWWWLALSASLSTLALGYVLIMLMTGSAALSGIQMPRFPF